MHTNNSTSSPHSFVMTFTIKDIDGKVLHKRQFIVTHLFVFIALSSVCYMFNRAFQFFWGIFCIREDNIFSSSGVSFASEKITLLSTQL